MQCLEPGSLNLRVDDETVDQIREAKELLFESPDEITYPEYCEGIPISAAATNTTSPRQKVKHKRCLLEGRRRTLCEDVLSCSPKPTGGAGST